MTNYSLTAPLSIYKIQVPLDNPKNPLLIYNEDRTDEFHAFPYEITGIFSRDLMSLFVGPKIYVYANRANGKLCIHGQAGKQKW